MKKYLFALALAVGLYFVAGCGDTEETPYTWGDVSLELSTAYCTAVADPCGYQVDVELCVEHSTWHLCNADRSCDREIADPVAAHATVAACAEAFATLDGDGCYFLIAWGVAPEECGPIWDLKPEADADAGPQ